MSGGAPERPGPEHDPGDEGPGARSPRAGHGFELGCDGPSSLVVGIDGSDTGWRALYYAVGQARRQHSRVVAVYAERAQSFVSTPTIVAPIVDPEADERFVEGLRETVVALGEEFGVATELVVVTADPVQALLAVADDVRADAIVVGASEQAGHRLFGSIAVRTVRTGARPVTVVP
ncbi:universal stress protein [Pseudonocardia benzenivorans]|uniref:UspA domain-containing protein n=2 Tax=Pseudonocardia TaxID=1847 RepID=F4CRG7_PSEUX|nr:universal stress protein [Pseudonocardia dioxanivorans]AEA26175.1 UspA domain-containing protein [Pseudonocardia dioxanivorans CB1190]GJF02961.1 universal stress protein A [Pseudonocardia sp. D17]